VHDQGELKDLVDVMRCRTSMGISVEVLVTVEIV